MENKTEKVTEEKIAKYREISEKALELARKNIAKSREKQAQEIFQIVECYLSDSEHFEQEGQFVNSLSCLNYAHGWLDCGARLRIFNVKDNRLFAV